MKRVWLVIALVACGPATQRTEARPPTTGNDASGSGSATVEKKPGEPSAFVKGAALSPGGQLVAWLENQKLAGEPKLVRVPVVLTREQVGWSLTGAKLGSAVDAATVDVTDDALGIGLGQRARKCQDAACAFLVEGFWRGRELAVVKASEPLSDGELAKLTHAEVEEGSGD